MPNTEAMGNMIRDIRYCKSARKASAGAITKEIALKIDAYMEMDSGSHFMDLPAKK